MRHRKVKFLNKTKNVFMDIYARYKERIVNMLENIVICISDNMTLNKAKLLFSPKKNFLSSFMACKTLYRNTLLSHKHTLREHL